MPAKAFTFFFILLWFLPVVFTFFQLDSYTISTVAVVIIFNLVYYLYARKVEFTKAFFSKLIFIFSFIFIHTISTALLFNKGYDFGRSMISILMMVIFLIGAFNLSRTLIKFRENFLRRFFLYIFYFYIFIILLSFITRIFPTKYARPIFPYPEPSHLALFLGPIIAYLVISAKKPLPRLMLIVVGLVISLLIKNMTLLLTIVILSVFVYNIYVIPILVCGSVGLYFFSDLEYFVERLDFANVEKTNNLSTMVYIKGFQLMEESLKMTSGLGIGFQQLGYVPLKTEIGYYMQSQFDGLELNSQDGGFTGAKIISEFGIIGAVIMLIYLVYLIRQWNRFRKLDIKKISCQEALFFASLITIFSEFFFRGLGYFTASMFLFLTVLFMRSAILSKKKA